MITNLYIDGFNLYYRALKDTPFRWLDLRKLAETLFPQDAINRVCYFTARLDARPITFCYGNPAIRLNGSGSRRTCELWRRCRASTPTTASSVLGSSGARWLSQWRGCLPRFW